MLHELPWLRGITWCMTIDSSVLSEGESSCMNTFAAVRCRDHLAYRSTKAKRSGHGPSSKRASASVRRACIQNALVCLLAHARRVEGGGGGGTEQKSFTRWRKELGIL